MLKKNLCKMRYGVYRVEKSRYRRCCIGFVFCKRASKKRAFPFREARLRFRWIKQIKQPANLDEDHPSPRGYFSFFMSKIFESSADSTLGERITTTFISALLSFVVCLPSAYSKRRDLLQGRVICSYRQGCCGSPARFLRNAPRCCPYQSGRRQRSSFLSK